MLLACKSLAAPKQPTVDNNMPKSSESSEKLDIASLKRCSAELLHTQVLTAVVIALGSNYQANYHLPNALTYLATLGETQISTPFTNPDFTTTAHQPKPDYVNQCVSLSLTSPITLQQLQWMFKQFENECDRQRISDSSSIEKVTMDIDILLIKLQVDSEWTIMAERYPFKAHERAGLIELLK